MALAGPAESNIHGEIFHGKNPSLKTIKSDKNQVESFIFPWLSPRFGTFFLGEASGMAPSVPGTLAELKATRQALQLHDLLQTEQVAECHVYHPLGNGS